MLIKTELNATEQDILKLALSKYIPEDIIVSLIYGFGMDFFLILSLLAGRTIKVPSLKVMRNLIRDIKIYSRLELRKESEGSLDKVLRKVKNERQYTDNEIKNIRDSYTKIKTLLVKTQGRLP